MRLTDADALLVEYDRVHVGPPGKARQLILDAPTIEPGPQWIPVSERLPEWKDHKNDVVLVCYGNGVILFNCYMEGCWVQGNPVAWMPLPEPYREENK